MTKPLTKWDMIFWLTMLALAIVVIALFYQSSEEEAVTNYPNTMILDSVAYGNITHEVPSKKEVTEYEPYCNGPDDCNSEHIHLDEPNELDIANIRRLGYLSINYADHAEGIINVNEYVRRGENKSGKWEYVEGKPAESAPAIEWAEPNESVDLRIISIRRSGDRSPRPKLYTDPNEVKE